MLTSTKTSGWQYMSLTQHRKPNSTGSWLFLWLFSSPRKVDNSETIIRNEGELERIGFGWCRDVFGTCFRVYVPVSNLSAARRTTSTIQTCGRRRLRKARLQPLCSRNM